VLVGPALLHISGRFPSMAEKKLTQALPRPLLILSAILASSNQVTNRFVGRWEPKQESDRQGGNSAPAFRRRMRLALKSFLNPNIWPVAT
jgi:hypothetical protein